MKKWFCLISLIMLLMAVPSYADTVGDYSYDVPEGFSLTDASSDINKQYKDPSSTAIIGVSVNSGIFKDPAQWKTYAEQVINYKTSQVASGLTIDTSDAIFAGNSGKVSNCIIINDAGTTFYYAIGLFYDPGTLDVYLIEIMHAMPKPFDSINFANKYTELISSIRHATKETPSESTGDVSPELVEQMEAYKEFFKEYVDFMKNVGNLDSSNSLSFLSDYSEFIQKYEDAMNALDKMDTENMSEADRKYYTNTMLEIDQMLLEGLKQ